MAAADFGTPFRVCLWFCFECFLTIDFDGLFNDFGSQKGVGNHEKCSFSTLLGRSFSRLNFGGYFG